MTARLNGCHNKPRPTEKTTYVAQAGWTAGFDCERRAVWTIVPHRMSTTYQYDKSATDKGCAGCQHGEQA